MFESKLRRHTSRVVWAVAAVTALISFGCNGGDGNQLNLLNKPSVKSDFAKVQAAAQVAALPNSPCIDMDGDGFGVNCPLGADCDDRDPHVTTQCFMCQSPDKGCNCNSEGEEVRCGEVASKVGKTVTCAVGTRVCSGGKWGVCNATTTSTIELDDPNVTADGLHVDSITGASSCKANNPCDPFCYQFGNPVSPSGKDPNVIPGNGGYTLQPAGWVDAGASQCLAVTSTAQQIPFAMVFALDTSGSMGQSGKCTMAGSALHQFITSTGVYGMYAGALTFPANSAECSTSSYANASYTWLNVTTGGIGPLGALPNTTVTAINNFANAYCPDSAGGDTPTFPALEAAGSAASAWVNHIRTTAIPNAANAKAVVVLMTDGMPNACDDCPNITSKKSGKKGGSSGGKKGSAQSVCDITELAYEADLLYFPSSPTAPSIETFVLGISSGDGTELQNLQMIARAGSGGQEGAYIYLTSGGAGPIITKLNSIRNQSLSNTFSFTPPSTGVVNPATSVVTLTYHPNGGAATTITLVQVADQAHCPTGTGSYGYEMDTIRDQIILCPTTYALIENDLSASISVTAACAAACTSMSTQPTNTPVDMLFLVDRSIHMAQFDVAGGAMTRFNAATAALRTYMASPGADMCIAGDCAGVGMEMYPRPLGCGDCQACVLVDTWGNVSSGISYDANDPGWCGTTTTTYYNNCAQCGYVYSTTCHLLDCTNCGTICDHTSKGVCTYSHCGSCFVYGPTSTCTPQCNITTNNSCWACNSNGHCTNNGSNCSGWYNLPFAPNSPTSTGQTNVIGSCGPGNGPMTNPTAPTQDPTTGYYENLNNVSPDMAGACLSRIIASPTGQANLLNTSITDKYYDYYMGVNPSVTASDYTAWITAGAAPEQALSNMTPAAEFQVRQNIGEYMASAIPQGSAPLEPALEGILAYALTQHAARPTHAMAVVLVTDGADIIGTNMTTLTANLASYYAQGITTLVMCTIAGSPGTNTYCDQVASAGSGNLIPAQYAKVVNGMVDLGSFSSAFTVLRQNATPCTFKVAVPSAGTLNYSKIQVHEYAGTVDPTQALGQATGNLQANCSGNQFTYTYDASWVYITLCPAACYQLKTDVNGRAEVTIPCSNAYTPGSIYWDYDVTGQCSAGTTPTWGAFWWDSVQYNGTDIQFFVKTAATEAALSSAPEFPLLFSNSWASNQACATNGMSPNLCTGVTTPFSANVDATAVRVDQTLIGDSQSPNQNVMRIRALLNPSSDGTLAPTLIDVNQRVDCSPSQ